MSKIIRASTLRNHLKDAIAQVNKKEKFFLISNRNTISSALVNIDFFEELLMANSPKYIQSVKEARQNYKEGKVYSHKDVFGEL